MTTNQSQGGKSRNRRVIAADGFEYSDDPGDIAKRVNYLEQLMLKGQYVRGGTYIVLSEKWGIRADTISKYASEASRRIALSMTPDDRRRLLISEAEQLSEHAVATGEIGAANQLIRTRADLEGLMVKKVQSQISFSDKDIEEELSKLGIAVQEDEST